MLIPHFIFQLTARGYSKWSEIWSSFKKVASLLRRYSGFHGTPPDCERFLASRKDNADERLDLPQVDPMNFRVESGAIIGDGDRKSWDACGPMIWDNLSIFRTNCAIPTSYIHAATRTCRGFSRGCCHVAWSTWKWRELRDSVLRIFHSDGGE